MPLQFIIGPAGCGKSHYLYQEIIRRASLERSRNFIVIVPEQYTMQTQEEILRLTESHGMINIDVLSFRRLAHRIFAETGGPARQPMEEIGKSFVLEKLALKHKKDLPLLGRGLTRSGNLAEMKSVISEFLEYGVDSTALDKARPDDRSLFAAKMREITLLYSAFEDYLRDHSAMTAEEMPGVLGEAVGTSQLLRGATLAFDGFTGFTPVQLTLVGRLMAVSGDIYAALTMDTEDNPLAALAPTALFSMSHEMAREMKTCADTAKIPFLPPIRLGRGGEPRRDGGHPATPAAPASRSAAAQGLPAAASGRFSRSRELAHLEANLFRRRRTVYGGKTEDIICFAAQTPREETEEAARRILRLVRTEGLRFRDIALITGDLPGYGKYIRQVFSSLDIPYFMDEKRDILRNPFVEYLRSAVSIAAEDFPEEAVTRFIRSGFSGISEEEADRLENYLLGSGIRGRRRYKEVWTYLYRGQDPAEMTAINACREKLTASLIPFAEAFARRGSTVREKTEALYRLLAASGAEQTLASDAARFESQGNMALGREYRQIYVRIMQLLERLVDVLGDEKISIRDYRDVLESGLKEERIGIIPPGSDQVRVGDMERSRIGGIRVLFFLGLNDGIVPKRKENASLLTEQDRETLASAKIRLKAGPREELAASRYYTYLALTRPSERLYLSYAGGNADGSPLRPSYLIRIIKELFPSLSEEGCAETFSERLEHPEHGIDMLSEAFGVLRSERPRSYHYELYRSLLMRKESARRVKILREAACVEPRRDQISKKAARALYGMRLMNSASRLERFSGCEFAHFLQYGLRLAEREVYSFSPMDTGNILHASLETFARALRDQGRTWQSLTEEERAELSAKCVREAALGYKGELMISSAENAFEIDRMARANEDCYFDVLKAIWTPFEARMFNENKMMEKKAAKLFRDGKDEEAKTYLALADKAGK